MGLFYSPHQCVINLIALQFLKDFGGGGKICFELPSSLICVLFVMYFYQQHFAIQLPLLNVIYLNKKM